MDEIVFDEFEGEESVVFLEDFWSGGMCKKWDNLDSMISGPIVDLLSNVLELILVLSLVSVLEGWESVFFEELNSSLPCRWGLFHGR